MTSTKGCWSESDRTRSSFPTQTPCCTTPRHTQPRTCSILIVSFARRFRIRVWAFGFASGNRGIAQLRTRRSRAVRAPRSPGLFYCVLSPLQSSTEHPAGSSQRCEAQPFLTVLPTSSPQNMPADPTVRAVYEIVTALCARCTRERRKH
ncbi:hypothetical protein EXIGLDRAFT_98741 [Exidia glandulosa HHB12029]|uniref:Uncharacterized protein n=1 Tax=Exidia glandulosa HHB12029 TaxID=1314781 RepID=A0A165H1A3_EXIGL|nr:hypothetical protein EXIGLDRAFT_98741 [Exidia glandulosa HHB12029]